MASFTKSVETINSSVRTFLALIFVGLASVGSWFGYDYVTETERAKRELTNVREELATANETLAVKEKTIEEQQTEIKRLDRAMQLLKVDHRVARLRVLDQYKDPDTSETITKISFVEVNDQGKEIGEQKTCTAIGDQIYVDGWTVTFEDKYVEEADIHRSTALFVFRRLYGDAQEPREGFVLDTIGSAPKIYTKGNDLSEFEREIWDDFWAVANSKEKQKALGIHAAHGIAPSIQMKKGKTYRMELGAAGRISLIPEETPPEPKVDAL